MSEGSQKSGKNRARSDAVRHWLESAAGRDADKPFIHSIDQDKTITYGAMLDLADRIAVYLAARGIGVNDRVALLSNNSIEHLCVYIGVMAHGATICTIHVEMNQAYFEDILGAVDARLVFYEEGLGLERLDGKVPGAWLPLGDWRQGGGTGFFSEIAAQPGGDVPSPANSRRDVASIFYTSGTATRPKGVVCSFAELMDNAAPTAEAFGMTGADRMLDFRSFNWMSAQVLGVLAPLSCGATLLLARRFSRSRFFDWIRDHGATIATGNPTTLNMLINRPVEVSAADVPQLRFITSSSAPLMVKQWKRFEEMYGIPVAQGYGTSETGWIAGSSEATRRIGSVGRPHAYHLVAIVDDDGNPVAPGETGLIELGGDAETEYRYLGEDGIVHVYARGRTRTGDIGYLDDDGYLHVTGRIRELIIRGGVNISPTEIDNVVLQLAGVADAAAVGVPDAIYGEEVVVYVAPREGIQLDAATVLSHCGTLLADAKMPKRVVFRDALPKTDRGKMDRNALLEDWQRENPG